VSIKLQVCVALSFPFIFLPCLPCSPATPSALRLIYTLFFVVVFQFGWAATQISHLALITDLTSGFPIPPHQMSPSHTNHTKHKMGTFGPRKAFRVGE
jgi:hypothetical protein